MPKIKRADEEPGGTWTSLVEELGNPLTAEPVMTRAVKFDRTGDAWAPFSTAADWKLPEEAA